MGVVLYIKMASCLDLEEKFDFQVSNVSPLGSYSLTLKKETGVDKFKDLEVHQFDQCYNVIGQAI